MICSLYPAGFHHSHAKETTNKQNRNLLLDIFPSLTFLLTFLPLNFSKTPNHPATSSSRSKNISVHPTQKTNRRAEVKLFSPRKQRPRFYASWVYYRSDRELDQPRNACSNRDAYTAETALSSHHTTHSSSNNHHHLRRLLRKTTLHPPPL